MKSKEIQAINKLNNIFKDLPTSVISQEINNNVQILVQGLNNLDQEVKQKEQLLVQKEKEFKAFKVSVDNNSKVARDIISESKVNLDQATSLYKSGKFSEALKYSDIALYNIGDINSFGVKTVEQANKLYVERLELYKESVAKRDYFYNQGVINGVNAFSWVKDNPTRDFYTFFRETLKVSDKSPENVNLINNRLYYNLPKYLQEAQRANHFYNEYNKYYDAMTKLQQVVNIHNIRTASSKGLKDYEEALKSCEIALQIDPQNPTLSNLQNAILQEKQNEEASKLEENNLLVSQTQEIERLKEQLSQKEIETQELLARKELEKKELLDQKELELANKSLVKNQVIGELQEDVGLKEKEAYKLQIELLTKQLEAAREIGKQKKINTELLEQNEILDLKMQYYDMEIKNKEAEKEIFLTQKQKLSFLVSQKEQEFQNLLIQKEIEQKELLIAKELAVADKSFVKNQVIEQLREEIEGLNKQLSDNQPIYRSIYLEERSCQPGESLVERQMASLDLSSINFSPINHGGQNQIVGNIIGNFDNQHITHSIYPSGEGSSFDIIDVENSH